jgi:hypothetical protein
VTRTAAGSRWGAAADGQCGRLWSGGVMPASRAGTRIRRLAQAANLKAAADALPQPHASPSPTVTRSGGQTEPLGGWDSDRVPPPGPARWLPPRPPLRVSLALGSLSGWQKNRPPSPAAAVPSNLKTIMARAQWHPRRAGLGGQRASVSDFPRIMNRHPAPDRRIRVRAALRQGRTRDSGARTRVSSCIHLDSCQVRHRIMMSDIRCPMSYVTSYVRYRTYDVPHDFEHSASYVCQHRRCNIRHRMSDIRYHRFHEIHVVYDVVCYRKP